MTLAEVIVTLQTWIRNADDEYDREEMGRVAGLKEALHEIKKIEPCGKDINVPATDAISRQAVLDGVDRYIYKSQSTGTQDDFYSFAELVVKQLPSVTPQPKTGHWIHRKMDNECWEECSECHVERVYPTLYCPDCGTKMEVEK